jgi:hypothetical protein
VLSDRQQPADAVVLSYSKPDGKELLFAMADRAGQGGWEQWFEIPNEASSIQAWAYDALKGRFTSCPDRNWLPVRR